MVWVVNFTPRPHCPGESLSLIHWGALETKEIFTPAENRLPLLSGPSTDVYTDRAIPTQFLPEGQNFKMTDIVICTFGRYYLGDHMETEYVDWRQT